jgi:NAD(P)-dependent dehydrogenase (short-subunit alcohol dehydrogenase family)
LAGKFPHEAYAGFKCNVTNEDDLINLWDNTVRIFEKVDIWVNNAGTSNEQEQLT